MTSTEIAQASKIMLGSTEAEAMYIGDTLIWTATQQSNGRLPAGYTEVEYISSTASGSQYINLGKKLYSQASPNFDLEMKFNIKGSGSDNSAQASIFSCQYDQDPWPGIFVRRVNNNVDAKQGSGKNADIGQMGTIITYNYNQSLGYNTKNTTHNTDATLFCILDTSNSPYRFAEGDLYYFKLWEGGVLTMDLVPCIDPNNVVGLYDIVNNTFYSSPNNAAFVAGNAVQ